MLTPTGFTAALLRFRHTFNLSSVLHDRKPQITVWFRGKQVPSGLFLGLHISNQSVKFQRIRRRQLL